MNYPPIGIVLTTYNPGGVGGDLRFQSLKKTLKSWESNLQYEGILRLHIAEDQLRETKYPDPTPFSYGLANLQDFRWREQIPTFSNQDRKGVGASLNTGFRAIWDVTPNALILYAVDDWALTEPFNLTPWARLLLEREDVGMVRLGPPHPNLSGTVEIFTNEWQGWGLRLARHHYAFGHRPALYHRRMIDAYGWFKEDCSALECEQLYNEKFCESKVKSVGPDIVLALQHPWRHLDSVELADIDPSVESIKEQE